MVHSDPVVVIVPGYGNSGPDHWQTHLEKAIPGAVRVNQTDWERPIRRRWVKGLDATLAGIGRPAILVGHSAGCLTIVHWTRKFRRPVAGALLVAPADMEAPLPGLPPPWIIRLAGWSPIPHRPLPFPSIVVGSSNDPMCTTDRAREFARRWGSRFVDLGAAGHINIASGYGPWPDAERLVASLAMA